MVKDIIKYPTPPSIEYGVDVRNFKDEEIKNIIQDLKDTIEANNLEGLAAFQIGSYYNIIVVKQNNDFLVLINPRIIGQKDKITTEEKTAYFGELSANVTRAKEITLIYQDIDGKNQTLKATDQFAILLQRKLDYCFGSSFINKLTKEEKEKFEQKLEYGANIAVSEYCPTEFKRDKISKTSDILKAIIFFITIVGLFFEDSKSFWNYSLYGSFGVLLLDIIYFFYAQYEGKQYKQCTSCQIGNIIGTVAISWMKLSVIMVISYFLLN